MVGVAEQIEQELRSLAKEGMRLARAINDGSGAAEHLAYQSFYTKALAALRVVAPDRYDEFVSCYEDPRRKNLTRLTFGVRDFYKSLYAPGVTVDNRDGVAAGRVVAQSHILGAVAERAGSVLADIRSTVQVEVLDEDLDVARQLLKNKHLRAAGAVAGVVLERHLASVVVAHNVKITKRSPTVADLNEPLRAAGVYDLARSRFIQHLADLRNLAVHAKTDDPTGEQMTDLINGVDKIVKTVY